MVDISELRASLLGLVGGLSALPLCPQLQEFRDQVADLDDEDGPSHGGDRRSALNTRAYADDSDSDGGGGGFHDVPEHDEASFDGGDAGIGVVSDDAACAVGGGGEGVDEVDPFQADTGDCWAHPRVFNSSSGGPSFVGNGKDGLDVASALEEGGGVWPAENEPADLQDRLCGDLKIVNDDYAFYDASALSAAVSKGNHWAGASHWKFAGIKKKPAHPQRGQSLLGLDGEAKAEQDGEGRDGDEGEGDRKNRGKRKPPAIDFNAPPVLPSALAEAKRPVRGRGGKKAYDPTLLSVDYIRRAIKAAEDGTSNYTLPENARFQAKDLGELFLRPGAFTKRFLVLEGGIMGVAETKRTAGEAPIRDIQGFHDSNNGMAGDRDDSLLFADANDGYNGGDDDDNDDDDGDGDGGYEGFHSEEGFCEGRDGDREGAPGTFVDDFEAKGLLSAGRRVEKINVNYARKAKRVDVRRLKGDLWRKIDDNLHVKLKETHKAVCGEEHPETAVACGDDAKKAEEKTGDAVPDVNQEQERGIGVDRSGRPEVVDMTFSDIVSGVACQEEQSGVTVPFYFICLLHLANEKGLKLEGRTDLLDFSVESDPVKEESF